MAIALEGTAQDVSITGAVGTNYEAETGSDRVVVWIIGLENFASLTLAPTMGGVAFTQAADTFIEGFDRSFAGVYYILEASIPNDNDVNTCKHRANLFNRTTCARNDEPVGAYWPSVF